MKKNFKGSGSETGIELRILRPRSRRTTIVDDPSIPGQRSTNGSISATMGKFAELLYPIDNKICQSIVISRYFKSYVR